jgi:hypothetical protein
MPYFICPNCQRRVLDDDRREGLTHQPVGCTSCGFGFLFELLEDYYPRPGTGLLVCDRELRVIATGRGVFELTGFEESHLLGKELVEAIGLGGYSDGNPAALALEWGVRRMGQRLTIRARSGSVVPVIADFFPAYDSDGGLLVALAPGG